MNPDEKSLKLEIKIKNNHDLEKIGHFFYKYKYLKIILNRSEYSKKNWSALSVKLTKNKLILYFIENQDNKTDAIICSNKKMYALVKKVSPYTYTIKHSYYDTEQYSWVIKPKYEDIDGSGEFSENLITVKNSDYLWGFINKVGKIVISIKYTSVGYFSDGLAKVRVGDNTGNKGAWGFIDKEGKFKVSPQFSKVKDYRNGVIAVRYGAEWGIIKLK